jgi:hypothetical protein
MANSRLILVEGIPGSGKTSTARFISDWLERRGQPGVLFQEGDWAHPADFESVACLDMSEYSQLLAQFPALAGFLAEHARQEHGEWFFSYRQMQHDHGDRLPAALFEALAHYEIYDLPVEKHQRLLLQRWQDFTAQANAQDTIFIFECCFLQNPTTTLLARHNLTLDVIQKHILALAEITAPLQPRLIYLEQDDVRATLENICRQRPKEWADFVTQYLTGQEYGAQHGLHEFDGVIDFYTIRQALELEFIQTLPIPSLVVSDGADWDARYKYLETFLEI